MKSRDVHDIHSEFERDDWYHIVHTPRGKHLQEYPWDQMFVYLGRIENIVNVGWDVRWESQKFDVQNAPVLSDCESFSWKDALRHWRLEVTAVDAPMNTYELAYLFPENYKGEIFSENASRFLVQFQEKYPDSALHVKLKWRKEDEVAETYSFRVELVFDPKESVEEEYRVYVRKADRPKGTRRLALSSHLKKKRQYKNVVGLAKAKINEWKKKNREDYIAVLTEMGVHVKGQ